MKPGDIRKLLIDYSISPAAFENICTEIEKRSESQFEVAVAKTLISRGYHLVQQWKVGAYRLDMVAVCNNMNVAIECDGERFHSGDAKIREDMERQTILERLGWRFIRIRGSEYYRNPEKSIERVITELSKYGIEPEDKAKTAVGGNNTELLQKIKVRASEILADFRAADSDTIDMETIRIALSAQQNKAPQTTKDREVLTNLPKARESGEIGNVNPNI